MADAINTGNPVSTTRFIINKRGDNIGGNRVNQSTPRGRLTFIDTDGRLTLPRTFAEANKAVFPTDWARPLNSPPYFLGAGLNGNPIYGINDGSLGAQENSFAIDPDTLFQTPWPAGIVEYPIPPYFLDGAIQAFPVASGNKALYFDAGTFTYGSGNYVGGVANYTPGQMVYASFETGKEGMVTYVSSGSPTKVGQVTQLETFGVGTITVAMKGTDAL